MNIFEQKRLKMCECGLDIIVYDDSVWDMQNEWQRRQGERCEGNRK